VITRLLYYFLESALLAAVVAGGAFPMMKKGLKILGYEVPHGGVKPFVAAWSVFLAAGIIGGELVGPTFLLIYRVVGLVVVLALSILILAPLLSKHIRIDRANAKVAPGQPSVPGTPAESSHDPV
jgi:hypothetical protein